MKNAYKAKLALLIGAQVAVLAVVVAFSYRPSVAAIDSVEREMEALSDRQAALCKMLKACPNPDDEMAYLRGEIQQLENRVPPESRVSWLSARIADVMQKFSVDLRSTTDWTEGGEKPPLPELKRLQKAISIHCTTENLQGFLEAVNRLPFLVVVEDLEVSRHEKWGTVSANVSLATFVLRASAMNALPATAVEGRNP